MEWLNYHHLHYFHAIAREGGISRASRKLRLAQSTLSAQLKELEEFLGQPLFERKGKRLELTGAGRMAMKYADEIFSAGQEMVDAFRNRPVQRDRVLRVGAIKSLSKNLQFELVEAALGDEQTRLVLSQGSFPNLIRDLKNHLLDLVISNQAARTDLEPGVFNHPLATIPVVVVGTPRFLPLKKAFPSSLDGAAIFLPPAGSQLRGEWDAWCEREKVRPRVRAEIEDVALLRIAALSGRGCALLPEIAVARELKERILRVIGRPRGLDENFYAITATRKFPNALVETMIRGFRRENA
jgi:LysR family transcriptional activator of nhaA